MRRRVITRVTTSFRFCLAAKTSSGTASSIPFRYNRRSCHCLPVSVKSDIRTSFIAFKPVQQCLSEAIFHLRLHIPLSLGTPSAKKSSGDFPVVWCTHVLSSSTSFPYGKIVTHFRWFVNGEFISYKVLLPALPGHFQRAYIRMQYSPSHALLLSSLS